MKPPLCIAAALLLSVTWNAAPRAAAGDFAAAKALYVAASYEDALAALNQLEGSADPIQVDAYRALCLVALGRMEEAEAPLEQIVRANPLYTLAADEVSPRLVDLFHDVRKRTLPVVARQIYAEGKASYDAKKIADANARFKMLLVVIADADSRATPEMADLKDLAEGFLALSAAQAAAAKTPPPAPPQPVAPAQPAEPRIYTSADRDVTPPVEIDRPMPSWTPPDQGGGGGFKGTLKVMVDEEGRVENAALLSSIYPTYNRDLLKAAKSWRYEPARRAGAPVKYALTIEIVLRTGQ